MAYDTVNPPVPGVTALPPMTVRQIGSGQVLVDPTSVVKELIENGLDARAKSIFVDITANTLASIQVKDDGHGIPAVDRGLVCRRSCTSKIRDFRDLRTVGARWLGFRGEALSSLAAMSGTLSITTRVEGEPVAVKLKYGRDGELIITERDSHPVGTTVKATGFLDFIPVRKQKAMENAARSIAKIRRLMQSYALARPAIRFRLHVLKTRGDRNDFTYAPTANPNVEDSALKIIGKECAIQCNWTVFESDGFKIQAYLPKPSATGTSIANQGAFISVDHRPVSSSRGTFKKINHALKERLRKLDCSLATVKDPFFCLNLVCPSESYDPNIEPTKDDVMFYNESAVLGVIEQLFMSCYPEDLVVDEEFEQPTSGLQPVSPRSEGLPVMCQNFDPVAENHSLQNIGELSSEPQSDQTLRWRPGMCGIDEDDMGPRKENVPPVIEEEICTRSVDVYNPWTLARMNAPSNSKMRTTSRYPSPAKSFREDFLQSGSPVSTNRPRRLPFREGSVSRTFSNVDSQQSAPDKELRQGIQHWPDRTVIVDQNTPYVRDRRSSPVLPSQQGLFSPTENTLQCSVSSPIQGTRRHSTLLGAPLQRLPELSSFRQCNQKTHSKHKGTLRHDRSAQLSNESWIGRPRRGSIHRDLSRRQKPRETQAVELLSKEASSPGRSSTPASEGPTRAPLCSRDGTDIRSFFKRSRKSPLRPEDEPKSCSSFESMYTSTQSNQSPATCGPSASARSDHHSFTTCDQNDPAYTSQSRCHSTLLDDTSAMTGAYQASEIDSAQNSGSAVCGREVHLSPKHGSTHKPRLQRCRTTDEAQPTQLPWLPLERTSNRDQIHGIILSLTTSIASIVQVLRKFDMARHDSELAYPPDKIYDAFNEAVTEGTIMVWVIMIDEALHNNHGRKHGIDVCSVLHESIQGSLNARSRDLATRTSQVTQMTHRIIYDRTAEVIDNNGTTVQQSFHEPSAKDGDEYPLDFDMSHFVSLDVEEDNKLETQIRVANEPGKKADSGFDGEVDDDMLLDI